MNAIAEQLQAPFAPDEYEFRVQSETKDGKKVMVLCYVTNRAIQQRLDDVFGPLGWMVSYTQGPQGGVMCTISVWDDERKHWVSKADGAENTDIEPIKGGYSGASKRAAYPWGIGRLLYKLPSSWVALSDSGANSHLCKNGEHKSQYRRWNPPALPSWAVAGKQEPSTTPPETKPVSEPPAPDSKPRAVSSFDHNKEFKEALRDKAKLAGITIDPALYKKIWQWMVTDPMVEHGKAETAFIYDTPTTGMDNSHTGWKILTATLSELDLKNVVEMLNA